MGLQAVFTIPDPDASFEKLFAPELADVSAAYKSNRAQVKLERDAKTKSTIITITADDATAMRAMANGVTKVLAIQHKMAQIK